MRRHAQPVERLHQRPEGESIDEPPLESARRGGGSGGEADEAAHTPQSPVEIAILEDRIVAVAAQLLEGRSPREDCGVAVTHSSEPQEGIDSGQNPGLARLAAECQVEIAAADLPIL